MPQQMEAEPPGNFYKRVGKAEPYRTVRRLSRKRRSRIKMDLAESRTYARELRIALELAREAGAAILDLYQGPLDIRQKFGADDREPVTQADTMANEIIVSRLRQEFPDDGILAEESVDTSHRLDKSRVWMIDPLDGTTGFIDGNGDFAVQIGLTQNGACVLGVVYQPLSGVLYLAVSGGGAWIERRGEGPRPRHVSATREI